MKLHDSALLIIRQKRILFTRRNFRHQKHRCCARNL